jgi:DnaD/phage-associated family protein
MSIKRMTAVWDHSKARGAQLLLLLAIADNAGDEGLAWPGLEELAKRTRVKKRAVIDQIEKLEKTGELRVLRRMGKHNYYIVDVGLTDADRQNALKRLVARVDEPIEELERELFSSPPEGKAHQVVQKRAPVRKSAPVQRHAPVQKRAPVQKHAPVQESPVAESAPPPVHETAPVPVQIAAPDPSVEPSIEPSTAAAAAANSESAYQGLAAAAAAAAAQPEIADPVAPSPADRPNAFALFEDNISLLTPIIADELRALLDEHPASWVEDAIREAARSGGRNVKYVAAILSRWQAQGKDPRRNGGNHANTRRSDPRADRAAQPRRERDPRRVRRQGEAWADYVARLAAQGLEPESIWIRG